jgi:tRNA dimethylallyltransferase
MGPTASGKTDLAIELCRYHPFELISVDSALVYRGMDIGTAKPDPALLEKYPHHLIDIRDPSEAYSASAFRADAEFLMHEIVARNRIPLLVGGTMLYFKTLRDGMADLPPANREVRQQINALAKAEGWGAVHRELGIVDPESAARIHANDPQRLQRAVEIFRVTGSTMTQLHRQKSGTGTLPFKLCQIAIVPRNRLALHEKISERFNKMLENGFLEEVKTLQERGDLHADMPAIRAVGYRQLWQHLQGEIAYDKMVELGTTATRQLAKRQLTWLRSWPDLQLLEFESPRIVEQALKYVDDIII